LIAFVLVAVLVFAGLNVVIGRMTPGDEHSGDEAPEASQSTPASAATSGAPPGSSNLASRPVDETLGSSSAQKNVVIGWSWTPDVQANPDAMERALAVARSVAPDARIRIVNTDAVPGAPSGVIINGRKVLDLPSTGLLSTDDVARAVGTSNGAPPAGGASAH
jgi:hypothetical protein